MNTDLDRDPSPVNIPNVENLSLNDASGTDDSDETERPKYSNQNTCHLRSKYESEAFKFESGYLHEKFETIVIQSYVDFRSPKNKETEPEKHLYENDEELVARWNDHWAAVGEELVLAKWKDKYSNYIKSNPDVEVTNGHSDQPITEITEDESQTTTENVLTDSTNVGIDCTEQNTITISDAEDYDSLWQDLWNSHFEEVYTDEYNNFIIMGKYPKITGPGSSTSTSLKKIKKIFETVPKEMKNKKLEKYWRSRYELFSKFDEGIKLDDESWYSVTPEKFAIHIAERCKTDGIIIDAFCGCGGNTIAFAKECQKVIAIDIDPIKIEYAKHNAKIYGVESKIEFIVGDFLELAPKLNGDVVFLSPPWGGPSYSKKPVFDIETMIPMNGIDLFKIAQTISPNIGYFLPKNVDCEQVSFLAGMGQYVEIEQNLLNDKIKAITAYYGNLIILPEKE